MGRRRQKLCYTLSHCGWKANNIGSERLENVVANIYSTHHKAVAVKDSWHYEDLTQLSQKRCVVFCQMVI